GSHSLNTRSSLSLHSPHSIPSTNDSLLLLQYWSSQRELACLRKLYECLDVDRVDAEESRNIEVGIAAIVSRVEGIRQRCIKRGLQIEAGGVQDDRPLDEV